MNTEETLCTELAAYCTEQGLPLASADDLLSDDVSPSQAAWLSDFCARWDAAMCLAS